MEETGPMGRGGGEGGERETRGRASGEARHRRGQAPGGWLERDPGREMGCRAV